MIIQKYFRISPETISATLRRQGRGERRDSIEAYLLLSVPNLKAKKTIRNRHERFTDLIALSCSFAMMLSWLTLLRVSKTGLLEIKCQKVV